MCWFLLLSHYQQEPPTRQLTFLIFPLDEVGSSTAGVLKNRTKRYGQSSITRPRGSRRRRALGLEYRNGTMLGRTHATSGCAAVAVARPGGRALKQERVPELRSSDVSVVRTRGC